MGFKGVFLNSFLGCWGEVKRGSWRCVWGYFCLSWMLSFRLLETSY